MNRIPKTATTGKKTLGWTTKEIAELLSVTPTHVLRLARAKEIPVKFSIRNRFFFDPRQVLRTLATDGVTEADIDRVLADCAGEVKP